MKRLHILIPALLAVTIPARAAPAEDTPMVWAFRHFCADEAFTLDEARLAVAVAGGKQRGPAAKMPGAPSVTFWDIAIKGSKLTVALGGQRVPAAPGGAADMVACTIYADGSDDAGVAALRRWAGVAPSRQSAAKDLSVYRFLSEKGKHLPEPDALSGQGDSAVRVWQLYLLSGPQPNASLIRFFKVREHS